MTTQKKGFRDKRSLEATMRKSGLSPKRAYEIETRVRWRQGSNTSPGGQQAAAFYTAGTSLQPPRSNDTCPCVTRSPRSSRSVYRNEKALSQPEKNAPGRTKKEPQFLPDLMGEHWWVRHRTMEGR
ncbi:hypothetical protein FCIRC_11793 [Fusarium circinatum]|uniref:Uncharacterized protein n=1 Tax=Fusarium circinatum TaxID=48490 RepID=A0A8H5T284_FUSCI|nr:hypothetical protein FCIRC_11793 [Fusarium circinatum]